MDRSRSKLKRALYARQSRKLHADQFWLAAAPMPRGDGFVSQRQVEKLLASLASKETTHLLRSPANATHLATSIRQARGHSR